MKGGVYQLGVYIGFLGLGFRGFWARAFKGLHGFQDVRVSGLHRISEGVVRRYRIRVHWGVGFIKGFVVGVGAINPRGLWKLWTIRAPRISEFYGLGVLVCPPLLGALWFGDIDLGAFRFIWIQG